MSIQDARLDDVALAKVVLEPLRNNPVAKDHPHSSRFVGISIDARCHRLASIAEHDYHRIAITAEVSARTLCEPARASNTFVELQPV